MPRDIKIDANMDWFYPHVIKEALIKRANAHASASHANTASIAVLLRGIAMDKNNSDKTKRDAKEALNLLYEALM